MDCIAPHATYSQSERWLYLMLTARNRTVMDRIKLSCYMLDGSHNGGKTSWNEYAFWHGNVLI